MYKNFLGQRVCPNDNFNNNNAIILLYLLIFSDADSDNTVILGCFREIILVSINILFLSQFHTPRSKSSFFISKLFKNLIGASLFENSACKNILLSLLQ